MNNKQHKALSELKAAFENSCENRRNSGFSDDSCLFDVYLETIGGNDIVVHSRTVRATSDGYEGPVYSNEYILITEQGEQIHLSPPEISEQTAQLLSAMEKLQ